MQPSLQFSQEHSHHPKKLPRAPCPVSPLSKPQPEATTKLLSVSKLLPFLEIVHTMVCRVYALPCMMHTHVFGPNFQEKKSVSFLIQFIMCLYLETKLMIIFQGIILHTDIIIAF